MMLFCLKRIIFEEKKKEKVKERSKKIKIEKKKHIILNKL